METPNEFEEFVRELLHLAGYYVEGEKLIGHKNVDIYAEERRFGKLRRIAVECKRYGSPLTREALLTIINDYDPLLRTEVDEILVVTVRGLAPSAVKYVENNPSVLHTTVAELQDGIMDCTAYMQHLISDCEAAGIPNYYISPSATPVGDLESAFHSWLRNGEKPLALLGSYGIGKTTFVRHAAARLAAEYLADRTQRIPIVVRLGDIAMEQSLVGLLAGVLTTGRGVRNYNFDAFMKLNVRGRFVIFLDGFDEMKQTLSPEQFRRNFTELNRLVVPDSRVVLSGRPTAFLSDDEQTFILHGIERSGDRTHRDPAWPDYVEWTVQPFAPEQVRAFVTAYLRHLKASGNSEYKDVTDHELSARLDDLDAGRLRDLAVRPVQLRMLVEVLPQWRGSLDTLTPATLYDTFINLIIRREQDKGGRSGFGTQTRREFARRLAFWMWMMESASHVLIDRIPESLFPPPDRYTGAEAIRRDMISACFLERKAGDLIFFPHRSFQEFLVAEEIVARTAAADPTILDNSSMVNAEIAEFVASLITEPAYAGLRRILRDYRDSLSREFLAPWAQHQKFAELLRHELPRHPTDAWPPILLAMGIDERTTDDAIEELANQLAMTISAAGDAVPVVLLAIIILVSRLERRDPGLGGGAFLRILAGCLEKAPSVDVLLAEARVGVAKDSGRARIHLEMATNSLLNRTLVRLDDWHSVPQPKIPGATVFAPNFRGKSNDFAAWLEMPPDARPPTDRIRSLPTFARAGCSLHARPETTTRSPPRGTEPRSARPGCGSKITSSLSSPVKTRLAATHRARSSSERRRFRDVMRGSQSPLRVCPSKTLRA